MAQWDVAFVGCHKDWRKAPEPVLFEHHVFGADDLEFPVSAETRSPYQVYPTQVTFRFSARMEHVCTLCIPTFLISL